MLWAETRQISKNFKAGFQAVELKNKLPVRMLAA